MKNETPIHARIHPIHREGLEAIAERNGGTINGIVNLSVADKIAAELAANRIKLKSGAKLPKGKTLAGRSRLRIE